MIYGNRWILSNILPDIDNAPERLVNPASMNITLGNSLQVIRQVKNPICLGDKVEYITHTIPDDGYVLYPGEFILATTQQYVRIPQNCAAFVQGRSSIGRIGLSIQNAGFIDPGFEGEITLELLNESNNAIRLQTGYPVGQLVFFSCVGVTAGYQGKYQHQRGATGSRMELDAIKKP